MCYKIKIMNKLICIVASGSHTEESPFKLALSWTKAFQAGEYIQQGRGPAGEGVCPEQQVAGRH